MTGGVGGRRALLLLLVLAAGTAAFQPARSYDLGWHLATGRLMVEQGEFPRQDPFSFTRSGTPWLNHEWLFQAAAYLVLRVGGWRMLLGSVILGGVILALLLFVALRQRGVDAGIAAFAVAWGLAGSRFRFDARPEMASLVFLALLLAILSARNEPWRGGLACLLPVLFLVWGNTHPAVLLGAAVTILHLAGELLQRGRAPMPPEERRRLKIVALSPLALLINPAGVRLLAVPLELRKIIASGHAPNLEWMPPAFRDFPLFFLAAGVAPVVLAAGWRRIDLPATLGLLLTGVLAFQQLRNIALFFLLLPVALGPPLEAVAQRARFPARGGRWLGGTALLLLALLYLRDGPIHGERDYLARVAPRKAVEFLARHRLGERLFNDVKFGGYLIWARYPGHRVFIDGRNEVYDPLLEEIFDALGTWERWEALLTRYGIDAALLRRGQMQAVRYPPETPGGAVRQEMRAFSAAYFQSSRWALVYWDDDTLLFVRRDDPGATATLDREYRVLNPDDLSHIRAEIHRGALDPRLVLEEAERKLREDPACRTAREIRDLLLAETAGRRRS